MGAEAYGLVGFFTMLQAWFNLLDMGLTPTVARETARFRGGVTDVMSYRRLLRALQLIFFSVALVGGGAIFLFSGHIANGWLNVQTLPLPQVKLALQLMAVGVALRWMSGLYRGCISGSERLVWLGGFNAFIATLRFVGILPVLIWIGHSPAIFFTYQLLVGVVELTGLAAKAFSLYPRLSAGQKLGWSLVSLFVPIKPVLKFSLTIAFTSSVWVLVTQTDKLVLSKLLPLAEYGYFTLAVLAASGVLVISGPISSVLLPRLTILFTQGNEVGLIRIYRNATQLVGITSIPVAIILAFFSEQVLFLWTGNLEIVHQAAPVLTLYALGNGILALSAFPYYLQYAKGDLKLHLIGNALFMVILIPALIWSTWKYGMIGAGYAWLGANAVYFLFWVPKIHRRFVKGLHAQWLLWDMGVTMCLTVFAAAIAKVLVIWPNERAYLAIYIIFLSIAILAIASFGSSWVRETIYGKWHIRFFK